jgi:hypothetical protein
MEDLKLVFLNDLKECEQIVNDMTNANYEISMGRIKKRLDLILNAGNTYNTFLKSSNAWTYTMNFTRTRLKNSFLNK